MANIANANRYWKNVADKQISDYWPIIVATLLLALQSLKYHSEAIRHIPQMVTYATVEKGMEYRGEQR